MVSKQKHGTRPPAAVRPARPVAGAGAVPHVRERTSRSRPAATMMKGGGAMRLPGRALIGTIAAFALLGAAPATPVGGSGGDDSTANVVAFGARPDGSADATPAFDEAAASLLRRATGGRLYLPAGRYRLDRTPKALVAHGTQGLVIAGDGIGATTVLFGGDGWRVELADGTATITVRDLSLVHAGPARAGTALAVTRDRPAATGGTDAFDHLVVGGVTRAVAWQDGVRLVGLSSPTITNVDVALPDDVSGSASAGGAGLVLAGRGKDQYAIDAKVANCVFQGGSAGIRVGPFVQGVFWSNSEALGGDYGVLWEDPGTGGSLPELLLMSGGHVNAHRAGVRTDRVNETLIEGVLFLHFAPSAGASWRAIDEEHTEDDTVTGNVVQGAGIGDETAFRFAHAQLVAISGNEVTFLSGPAVALPDTSNATVAANTFAGVSVSAPIVAGAGNAVDSNGVNGRGGATR